MGKRVSERGNNTARRRRYKEREATWKNLLAPYGTK